jgi:hypothetical protein
MLASIMAERRGSRTILASALALLGALMAAHTAHSSGCTTTVSPGDDVQGTLTAAGSGSTVCFAAGTFRIASPLAPEPGQTLAGAAGRTSVLDGARVVTDFTSSGTIRVNRIKVPVFSAPAFLPRKKGNHGFCRIKGCTLQEDVSATASRSPASCPRASS